jgi:hypothetical protein
MRAVQDANNLIVKRQLARLNLRQSLGNLRRISFGRKQRDGYGRTRPQRFIQDACNDRPGWLRSVPLPNSQPPGEDAFGKPYGVGPANKQVTQEAVDRNARVRGLQQRHAANCVKSRGEAHVGQQRANQQIASPPNPHRGVRSLISEKKRCDENDGRERDGAAARGIKHQAFRGELSVDLLLGHLGSLS